MMTRMDMEFGEGDDQGEDEDDDVENDDGDESIYAEEVYSHYGCDDVGDVDDDDDDARCRSLVNVFLQISSRAHGRTTKLGHLRIAV